MKVVERQQRARDHAHLFQAPDTEPLRIEVHYYPPEGHEIDSKGTLIPERTLRRIVGDGGGVLMTVSPVGHSPGPSALPTIMGDDEDCIAEEEDDIFGPERRRGP